MEKEKTNLALQYSNSGISGDLLFQQRLDKFISLYHAALCEEHYSALSMMFHSCVCLYVELNHYLKENEKQHVKGLLDECESALPYAVDGHKDRITIVLKTSRKLMEFLVAKTHELGFVRGVGNGGINGI